MSAAQFPLGYISATDSWEPLSGRQTQELLTHTHKYERIVLCTSQTRTHSRTITDNQNLKRTEPTHRTPTLTKARRRHTFWQPTLIQSPTCSHTHPPTHTHTQAIIHWLNRTSAPCCWGRPAERMALTLDAATVHSCTSNFISFSL